MNLHWIQEIMDQQIVHLKNDPKDMLNGGMINLVDYNSMCDRNAFAIHQIEHLKVTIKEFIKNVNNL